MVDLSAVTALCEGAYADASREGYADDPDVVAGVANLKAAHAALVAANASTSWWKEATLASSRALFRCENA